MSDPLRRDHTRFALRVHRALTDTTADVVWSPHSVARALALIALGSRGRTHAELMELLGERPQEHLAALDAAVDSTGEADLVTTTALWLARELPLRSDFATRVRSRPGSELRTADFRDAPEEVREAINAAVAETTRGRITELLAPGMVHRQVQAVLVNALWVRLRWHVPFDPTATAKRWFATPSGKRSVAMMRRRGEMSFAAARGWQLVSLPGEDALTLDILLPDTDAAPLGADTLAALHHASAITDVDLALPRFVLTHRRELSETLTGLGARTLFTDDADLTGISARPLALDAVIHQARLHVDEEGAEGAAATAGVMRLASLTPRRPVVVTVDRPFHCVLRRHGTMLFLGTVSHPADPRDAV